MKDSTDLELSHETMERIFNQLLTKTLLTMRTSKIAGLKETSGTHLSKKDREQCEAISPCIHCFCRDHHVVKYCCLYVDETQVDLKCWSLHWTQAGA